MAEQIIEADGVDLDMFGNPVQPYRDPRGRRKWSKSIENQRIVSDMRGAGKTQDEICEVLGCDPKTLRKYYSRELDHGALFLEFEALQVLKKRMMEGNVAAAKAILEIARASNAPKTRAPSQADKQSKLGKKETLRRDAEAPPTSWGDLLN